MRRRASAYELTAMPALILFYLQRIVFCARQRHGRADGRTSDRGSEAPQQAESGRARTVTLTDNATGKSVELPHAVAARSGPKVIDIRTPLCRPRPFHLRSRLSPRPGAANPRSPISTATRAILLYRGYPIEELAEHSDFMEVAYLLLNGELPTPREKTKFERDITHPHHGARAAARRSIAASGATRIRWR